jgi:EAL domain-containing protein (putative c-di-GMP-specific phosphodiesterase class I)
MMLKRMALSTSAPLLAFFAIGPALADHEFIRGCATMAQNGRCVANLDLADGVGARAVAEVENRDDFLASRELGFDLTQRFLFGKLMVNGRFAGP